MSEVSVPDSCRALLSVLIPALQVLATEKPQFLVAPAATVGVVLRLVDHPRARGLGRELFALATQLDAAVWNAGLGERDAPAQGVG